MNGRWRGRRRGKQGNMGGGERGAGGSEKLLVYWEGGRRTRDIRRLKIERERERDREQLKRRKYCELISVARG